MSQSMFLKASGLATHPNNLTTPEGSLSIAKNVVIDQENVITPRRGLANLTYDYLNSSHRALKLINYQDQLLSIRTGSALAWYDTSSGWTDLSGTYSQPTGALAVHHAQAKSNLFLTTSTGIKVMDRYNSVPYLAGMPRGLDLTSTLSGASGFMANNTQVAYRVVWGRKDLNSNLILGAPSQRSVVSNSSGGTRDVSITITIPATITATDFVQVYRSGQSATSTTEPNDEMYLVYEKNPTAGEITARSMTFVDSTPDSLVGVTLYTSASQEGLLQSNEQPPLAKDVAFFKGCLFYANTVSKQRLSITLLQVGGTAGVQLNDVITIAGTTYTAKAAENVASREFQLVTGGSAQQNIADTAESLVRVVNQNTTNTTVYAYVTSGYDDLPGKILIEERTLGGAQFSAIASANGGAFNPTLPTSGTTVSSKNDVYQNGLAISKLNEVEAVPLTNILFQGSSSDSIQRIVPLRDALIVLSDSGVFRITGTDPNSFQVELLDSSASLTAPESVAVLNNQVFALTSQGIVQISDGGVQVLSRPIEITLLELQGLSTTTIQQVSFGIGYESDRKYMLFAPTSGTDTYARQAFVYNLFTNSWTIWEKEVGCGIINPADDKLYLGSAVSAYVLKERKDFSFTDHVDEELPVTVNTVTGTTLSLQSSAGVEVGDLFYESASKYAIVESVTGNDIVVSTDRTFTTGAREVRKRIPTIVEYNPLTAGNPGIMKHWADVTLMFKDLSFQDATVGFKSELSQGLSQTTINGRPQAGWGLFAWGSSPWGGGATTKNIRTFVVRDKSQCSQLTLRFTHACSFSRYSLSGVSLQFNAGSERITR